MTFSARVKAELCRLPIEDAGEALAEFAGIALFANTFDARMLRVTTENELFAKRVSRLMKNLFGFDFDKKVIPGSVIKKYNLTVESRDKLRAVFEAFGFDVDTTHSLHLNGALVEDDKCRSGFLRGAFLAGGSATEPARDYHLEFVTSHYHLSREVVALLLELELPAKVTSRKGNQVIYFKESGHIEDLLTRIGAPVSAMTVMETKMYKELRNSVNRKVNCETANLTKTVDAAAQQLRAIEKLRASRGLDALPETVREAAELRLKYPEATLQELAVLAGGRVTKSGLNHRFRKLMELAREK